MLIVNTILRYCTFYLSTNTDLAAMEFSELGFEMAPIVVVVWSEM